MNEEDVKELKSLLTEIRNLLKRQVHLFEKYDEELFSEQEDVRELQNKTGSRRRR
jgi:hypothetical protein